MSGNCSKSVIDDGRVPTWAKPFSDGKTVPNILAEIVSDQETVWKECISEELFPLVRPASFPDYLPAPGRSPMSHYDVIIIGTGPGGGTLAYKLAPSGMV